MVYVVSKGGNTQNNGVVTQSNTAAAFIAIYGSDCKELTASNFVYMSEVTTVATMAAAAQFFDPRTDTLVADGTGQQKGIVDEIPNTVALLANSTTGLAVPSTTLSAAPGANVATGTTVTAIPQSSKLNLIADIISACINGATSGNPACGTLFSSAVSPIPNTTSLNPGSSNPFPAATDTLQALYYMFTNPTNSGSSNLSALFGLAGGVGAPYQPSASQPTDWTIAIAYASNSTTGSATCGTPSGGTGGFFSGPIDIGIDGQDNVWVANSQTGGNLSGIKSNGAPLACVNFGASTTANAGGTVDSSGNVWFASGTTMYRYNPNSKATFGFPAGVTPLAITADGLGNVYFSASAGSTGSLYQLPGAATASAVVSPVQISNLVGPNPVRLMPDYQGCVGSPTCVANPVDIWVSSGANFVSQVGPTSTTGSTVLNGFITNTFPISGGNAYGLDVSRGNSVFVSAADTGAITRLDPSSGTWAPVSSGGWPFTASTAGISSPTAITLDGARNTWIPNQGSASVSEISFFGANPLSPSTGFLRDSTILNSNRASAVDQAGNLWVVGAGNTFIAEFVGAAVPIYQPYAVGITNGRFQQIP